MSLNKEELWFEKARAMQFFFHRQIWHLLAFVVLVPVTWAFAAPVLGGGAWLGIRATTWFWLGVCATMLHQMIVWIVFRLQLGWATLSKIFGRYDLVVWGIIFLPLLVSRVVFTIGLAKATQGSLILPQFIAIPLGITLLIPGLYTLWSVFKCFGLTRAMVGDHFRIRYRKMPLVDQGMFKFSSNAMYSFAFLLLWAIALIIGSQAALSAALFQHAAIWVHYYCTEAPDMNIIYGGREA